MLEGARVASAGRPVGHDPHRSVHGLATVEDVRVLLVSDAAWVRNQVHGALSGSAEIVEVTDPYQVETAATGTDLSIVDMQVGSMGAMAITRALKAITPPTGPIVVLLDRSADAFIAKRAGADGWLAKPFSAQALRRKLAEVAPVGAIG
ncbi:MAG: response regulator [Acidimicrobiia bacterium]|nr:response regulator [Acidimicrobiia bacterium]MYC84182.1 response regulator [Acidimicrobiia bacterium]